MRIVYDRTYPPATTDFAPIVRAVQASNPDLFVICSYPLDSVGMVRAVNEIGYKPKMIGGAMVGLQATVFKRQLGPLLNGWVNYETWVPSDKMMLSATEEFLKKYQARAGAAGVDPLGYYLGTWGYAYIRSMAMRSARPRASTTASLPTTSARPPTRPSMATSSSGQGRMGEARHAAGAVPWHQEGAGLDVWRGMSYQTVLTPSEYKTGNVIYPFEKAK